LREMGSWDGVGLREMSGWDGVGLRVNEKKKNEKKGVVELF